MCYCEEKYNRGRGVCEIYHNRTNVLTQKHTPHLLYHAEQGLVKGFDSDICNKFFMTFVI